MTFSFLQDGEDEAEVNAKIFGVHSYPTSFIINPDGKILFYHLGFEKGDEVQLDKEIERVLNS